MTQARLTIICVALLLAIVAISVFASTLVSAEQAKQALREEAKATAYGVDGKPGGGELDSEPVKVTSDHVYFADRVLERFHYDAQAISQSAQILAGAMNAVPESVNKYLMLVPARITFEDKRYERFTDDAVAAINEVYAAMPADVVTLDVASELASHAGEYMYFRTDRCWTALGAYYAARLYCASSGIDVPDINEYREHTFTGYVGSMRGLEGVDSLNLYTDYVSYYTLEGAVNRQTITVRRSQEKYVTYDSPTIALSRRGNNIFVGGYFSHTIIYGDAQNGRTLMMAADEYGKALATWLMHSYEKIFLVDPRYFNGGPGEIQSLFAEINPDDFLILEYAGNMGNSVINSRIKALCPAPPEGTNDNPKGAGQ